jgi:hypothetical protein
MERTRDCLPIMPVPFPNPYSLAGAQALFSAEPDRKAFLPDVHNT